MKPGTDLIWLSEADVASLLSMNDTVAAVESAFKAFGLGEVQMPQKAYLDFEPFGGDLRTMPAYLKGNTPAAGVKIVNSNARNPEKNLPAVTGIMTVIDPETGLPVAVTAAGHLTALRTGAAGGVAAKYLARPGSSSVGLVGCGRQALTQLEALGCFFTIKKVLVWGKTPQEAHDFCIKHKETFSGSLVPCQDLKEVCGTDIVVTTTPVRSPLVQTDWIQPGTHINAIGADAPGKQELAASLLKKAKVFVDDWRQSSHGGEINKAVSTGEFTKEDVAGALGELIAGRTAGRASETDITIFDSTGLAIQDVAVAQRLIEKAKKSNKGQVLSFNG